MEINYFLISFAALPFLGLIASLVVPFKKEGLLSGITFYTVLTNLLATSGFVVYWIFKGRAAFNMEELVIYRSAHYQFLIDFYFDEVTAVYLLVGSFVTVLIARYSAYYMHLESGYKRFFNTILLFYFGFNFTVLSGNFETLFVGWEILGVSSFLLIAFYRDRYLPVRNAVKVFSIYRIGDVGILLAIWASHHFWHESITFHKLGNYDLVHENISSHTLVGFLVSVCLLIAAAAKSAQFPYSSWLPRAMEGPTPSSAIFYGSLSVHFGVFLLLRTYPFWEHQLTARILIGTCGFVTAVIAFFITRVQSTIKAQIAYASIAQIGLMFIEIALGWKYIVLIHFAGNAFLRTYQLLISPSVVSYSIRDQFYHFRPKNRHSFGGTLKRIEYTIYMLSMKEWGLDRLMSHFAFRPLKRLGQKFFFINQKNYLWLIVPGLIGSIWLYSVPDLIPTDIYRYLPYLFMAFALLLVLRSFAERVAPFLAWWLIMFYHLWVAIAISFNEKFSSTEIFIFLSGFGVASVTGSIVLFLLRRREPGYFDLNGYYGHVYEHNALSVIFLTSAMAMMGFPITFSFIGEDLIISHIHDDQLVLTFLYALSYVICGIALIRIYARLFLGPHIKTYHSTAVKSA